MLLTASELSGLRFRITADTELADNDGPYVGITLTSLG